VREKTTTSKCICTLLFTISCIRDGTLMYYMRQFHWNSIWMWIGVSSHYPQRHISTLSLKNTFDPGNPFHSKSQSTQSLFVFCIQEQHTLTSNILYFHPNVVWDIQSIFFFFFISKILAFGECGGFLLKDSQLMRSEMHCTNIMRQISPKKCDNKNF